MENSPAIDFAARARASRSDFEASRSMAELDREASQLPTITPVYEPVAVREARRPSKHRWWRATAKTDAGPPEETLPGDDEVLPDSDIDPEAPAPSPPASKKPKNGRVRVIAPAIDRVLSDAKEPLTFEQILEQVNAHLDAPSTRRSIEKAISRYRVVFGWVRHGSKNPAQYRKCPPSGSADSPITEKTVRAVSHSSPSNEVEKHGEPAAPPAACKVSMGQSTPDAEPEPSAKRTTPSERYDAAKMRRDNLSASAMLETMTDLLAVVRTLRGSLAEIGVTFEDRFFVASVREETGRRNAPAGIPAPKDG